RRLSSRALAGARRPAARDAGEGGGATTPRQLAALRRQPIRRRDQPVPRGCGAMTITALPRGCAAATVIPVAGWPAAPTSRRSGGTVAGASASRSAPLLSRRAGRGPDEVRKLAPLAGSGIPLSHL